MSANSATTAGWSGCLAQASEPRRRGVPRLRLQVAFQLRPCDGEVLAGDEQLSLQQPGAGMIGVAIQGGIHLGQGVVEFLAFGRGVGRFHESRHRFAA